MEYIDARDGDLAERVRLGVQKDIEHNRELVGKDYSIELGVTLTRYLHDKKDLSVLAFHLFRLGDLEKQIEAATGILPSFAETKTSAFLIHLMYLEGNTAGLDELGIYAGRLLAIDQATPGGE